MKRLLMVQGNEKRAHAPGPDRQDWPGTQGAHCWKAAAILRRPAFAVL
ncbi:hypothetical protein [Verminephrobacter eiseniae]|nr:hypothetical protein [Verminephrobacter eiseniae]